MSASTTQIEHRAGRGFSWCRANRHFLVASGVLAVTSAWWLLAPNVLRWFFRKPPVPWPADVRVGEDFRWRNLPERLGHYVLAGDGELRRNPDGTPKRDGQPDGQIVFRDDLMRTLGVGTHLDETRYAQRRSNWYVARVYRDTRPAAQGGTLRYWRLDVTYYTGGLDTVPHVPEVCLVAGGADVLDSAPVTFSVPAAPSPWDRPFVVRRTRYRSVDDVTLAATQYVQYYVFSLNGIPETSWKRVRLRLMVPWVEHCYFAKIQFSPRQAVTDVAEADRLAEEFANAFLPSVLRALPTAADVEALDAGPGVGQRAQ